MGEAPCDTHHSEERCGKTDAEHNQPSASNFGHQVGSEDGACNTKANANLSHHTNLGRGHTSLDQKVRPI